MFLLASLTTAGASEQYSVLTNPWDGRRFPESCIVRTQNTGYGGSTYLQIFPDDPYYGFHGGFSQFFSVMATVDTKFPWGAAFARVTVSRYTGTMVNQVYRTYYPHSIQTEGPFRGAILDNEGGYYTYHVGYNLIFLMPVPPELSELQQGPGVQGVGRLPAFGVSEILIWGVEASCL